VLRRALVSGTAVLAITASTAGCTRSHGRPAVLQLISSGGSTSAAIPNVARSTPFLFRTYNLCASRGAVKITDVVLTKPVGLKIVDWGVSTKDGGIAAAPGTVSELGFYTHGPVTAACTSPGVILDISVQGSTDVSAANGFVVHYKSGQVNVPLSVMLCTATCPRSS
jgi:hypothetical protein